MRLARLGYRSEMIASTTYEEAPAQFAPWLRQRTRWFKGWMRLVNCYELIRDLSGLSQVHSCRMFSVATISQQVGCLAE
jgi:cellulose synthase/poly-beta-1,6-N-acetylglucosamine synthase-like glycosyltransferase